MPTHSKATPDWAASDSASATSASFTPANGSRLYVFGYRAHFAAGSLSISDSEGLTWTEVEDQAGVNAFGLDYNLQCWHAPIVTGVPMTITISDGSTSPFTMGAVALEVEGASSDTPAANTGNQGLISQGDGAQTFTFDMPGTPDSGSLVFAWSIGNQPTNWAPGTGWTQESDFADPAPYNDMHLMYNGTPSSATVSYSEVSLFAGALFAAVEIPAAAGGDPDPMTAETGAFALTGNDAGLAVERRLIADVGVFALSGIDAGLVLSLRIEAETGAFTLSGIDAALTLVTPDANLEAETGDFILTGHDAALAVLRVLEAEVGAFVLTGVAADLLRGFNMEAETGAFALTGIDANLTHIPQYRLTAEAGAFVLTGFRANINGDEEGATAGGNGARVAIRIGL